MTTRTNKSVNRTALLKLALVMLVGTSAGVAMFFATLRSHSDSATSASGALLPVLSGLTTQQTQTFSANTLYSKKTPAMTYLKESKLLQPGETVWDLLKKNELPETDVSILVTV